MTDVSGSVAMASQGIPGLRGFQVLGHNDLARLEAFFLAFDLDQRREYFGGDVADTALRDYCNAIRWGEATIIARSGPHGLEAIAIVAAIAPDQRAADLSMACPSAGDRQPIVADMLDLALMAASLSYRQLIVYHDHAMPELLSLLRGSGSAKFDGDIVRIDVPLGNARLVAC
ncbi:hypothetical protein [Bradyrhizobium sp. LHD-71]|uniref:hypothetical protein n=1 Tax=Bradyrhizobium sp. LHD-71 TaxID=3072141 RepID=UPI00281074D2|nr:hypothetical protein [Bradyrhizobium sp. LHD-71]MDQ8731636.1 hypothetical protein [Bradyrhizobium sp. LHD-71]